MLLNRLLVIAAPLMTFGALLGIVARLSVVAGLQVEVA